MDNISINKANYLYWLGRYAERAYTTIAYLRHFYDEMVDKNQEAYLEFCSRLGVINNYSDKRDFVKRFISDEGSEISIAYYIGKTYDNGMVLRDTITSRTLSYIQLACNDLKKCYNSQEYVVVNLQSVTDDLIAFWGAVDDYILENDARDLIKAGKYIERVELYKRFDESEKLKKAAIERLYRYAINLGINENASKQVKFINSEDMSEYNSMKNYIDELSKWGVGQ